MATIFFPFNHCLRFNIRKLYRHDNYTDKRAVWFWFDIFNANFKQVIFHRKFVLLKVNQKCNSKTTIAGMKLWIISTSKFKPHIIELLVNFVK